MKSDIELAKQAKLLPVAQIAAGLGIEEAYLCPYGKVKAKIDLKLMGKLAGKADGKLILVTAINPTPAGEGKTTVSVGLGDGLAKIGKKTVLALREPSLGPVFGVKGGAAGGGLAQVVPMEDLNLHFTGDLHAITAANNLLAAMVDNHLFQGNKLRLDKDRILWKRCLDVNDRQLREIQTGIGGKMGGVPHKDGFHITAASEVMAIFCLATSLTDLKARLARIVVALNEDGEPVTAGDLHAEGAMTALLKDALNPNLVQTMENTPVLIHGGPFANIAHGCNSITATRMALKLGDYVVTEAGFGADLGAEKFLDIKCRAAGLTPDAVVIVATVKALKFHGGVAKEDLGAPNPAAVEKGLANLTAHIANIRDKFSRPVVVAINHYLTDSEAEIAVVVKACEQMNVPWSLADMWAKGGAGCTDLAEKVVRLCDGDFAPMKYLYDTDSPIKEKIEAICVGYYGADGVDYTDQAQRDIDAFTRMGYDKTPICIAKTPLSISDDAALKGKPEQFRITVRGLNISAGAGFLVALTGNILTMPGLPPMPAAEHIDVDETGEISGLF